MPEKEVYGTQVWFGQSLEDLNTQVPWSWGKRHTVAVGSKVTRKTADKGCCYKKEYQPAIVSEKNVSVAGASVMFMAKIDYRGAKFSA